MPKSKEDDQLIHCIIRNCTQIRENIPDFLFYRNADHPEKMKYMKDNHITAPVFICLSCRSLYKLREGFNVVVVKSINGVTTSENLILDGDYFRAYEMKDRIIVVDADQFNKLKMNQINMRKKL